MDLLILKASSVAGELGCIACLGLFVIFVNLRNFKET